MTRIPASAWFVALCLAWLVPGLIGHAPWKGPDAETFAALLRVREQGDWLLPGKAADLAPLYFWIAQGFAQVFSSLLPLHDAVRLVSGALAAFALWLTALTAQRLYGPGAGWPAVFALLGCMGLLVPAHEINPYMAQLAALALFAYGLVRMLREPLTGGGLAGLGLTALFLSGAWLPALALAAVLLALPGFLRSWRTSARVGGSWFALTVALALCGAWLLSVQGQAPDMLAAWRQHADSTLVFAAGEKARYQPLYFVEALAWFAWPAWPVAGWAIYRLKREGWDSVRLWMPLGVFLASFVALSLQAGSEQIQSIILLPPLALLAGAGLAELRRGAANALMWFSIMAFSFFGLVFWLHWTAFDLGWPLQLSNRLAKLGLQSEGLRPLALLLGLVATAAWIVGLSWIRRQPRVPQRPILVWSAGLVFVWCLLLALFLSPLDKRLSYAGIAHAVQAQTSGACMAARNLGNTHRMLLAYHGGLDIRAERGAECDWLLVYTKGRKEVKPSGGWVRQWEGARPGEKGERFWLYRRTR